MSSIHSSITRAGRWFLESGIQGPSGGIARYYQSEVRKNKPISTEITGYAASALTSLFKITGDEAYLDCACRAAQFLIQFAWDQDLRTFVFEYPSPSSESAHQSYFFDCGIIVRSLLAVWRQTKRDELISVARDAAYGMIANFHSGWDYHPIVSLPGKQPLPRTDQWSRSVGCYQLKAALSWVEMWQITGDQELKIAYYEMLSDSLATEKAFLPAATMCKTMDRLHSYIYFLEGLMPVLDRSDCVTAFRNGIESVNNYVREIGPSFIRSDVVAQLLRARIVGAPALPLPPDEVQRGIALLLEFQAISDDPTINGGFRFGRVDGIMSPHLNPVSTAFAIQTLGMSCDYQSSDDQFCREACQLI
jgi:hypothetical protein